MAARGGEPARGPLLVLVLALAGGTLRAGELPVPLARATRAWDEAVAAERVAAAALGEAEARASEAAAGLAAASDAGAAWERLQAEVTAAEAEVVPLLEARARLDVVPAGAAARRRELRRQWDLLAPARVHLAPGVWAALDHELRDSVRAAREAAARATGAKRALDERRAAAVARLEQARSRRDASLQVDLPEGAWETWWSAAGAVARAREVLDAAEEGVGRAYQARLEAAAHGPPVFLRGLEVRVGERLHYAARWEGEEASLADHARLAAVRHDLDEIRAARRQASAQRLGLALEARPDVAAIQAEAAAYGEALMAKEVGTLLVEIGVTAAELALTGGGATLARKAAEATEKAATLAARSARAGARQAASKLESRALGDAVYQAADKARALGLDEAIAARRLWRQRYLDEVASRARARASRASAEAREKAVEKARRQAEAALAELEKKARRLELTEPVTRELIAGTRALGDRLAGALAGGRAGFARGASSAALAKGMAGLGNALAPPSGPGASQVAGRVLVSDLLERGMAIGVEAGAQGATRALGELGSEASRWRKLGRGAAGFARGLKWRHLREVGANPANLVGLVGTLTKAGVAGYYQGEANAAQARFWQRYAALHAVEAVIARSLEADRELAALEADHVRALAAAEARYSLGLGLRTLRVSVDEPMPATAATASLALDFSGPLAGAPRVEGLGAPLPLRLQGDRWVGEVHWEALSGSPHDLRLRVLLPPGGHPLGPLDGAPATPAHRNPRGFAWHGWEREPDSSHRLRRGDVPVLRGGGDGPIPYEGNYLARFPGLGDLEGPLRLTLTRGGDYRAPPGGGRIQFRRAPDAGWAFLAATSAGRRVGGPLGVHAEDHGGKLRVGAEGVRFELRPGPRGSSTESVQVRLAGPGDGDLAGTWEGREVSGPVTWTRVAAEVTSVRAKLLAHPVFSFRVGRLPAWQGIDRFREAPVVAEGPPGAPLSVDLGVWYRLGDVQSLFTPETHATARGNRPRLRLEILGRNLWGRHYVEVDPTSGLEVAAPWPLPEDAGIGVDLVMWQGLRPGVQGLWLDGRPLPLRLVIPGR